MSGQSIVALQQSEITENSAIDKSEHKEEINSDQVRDFEHVSLVTNVDSTGLGSRGVQDRDAYIKTHIDFVRGGFLLGFATSLSLLFNNVQPFSSRIELTLIAFTLCSTILGLALAGFKTGRAKVPSREEVKSALVAAYAYMKGQLYTVVQASREILASWLDRSPVLEKRLKSYYELATKGTGTVRHRALEWRSKAIKYPYALEAWANTFQRYAARCASATQSRSKILYTSTSQYSKKVYASARASYTSSRCSPAINNFVKRWKTRQSAKSSMLAANEVK